MALLLSSYFIYNSVGVIDGDAINRLNLVVNLTKHIHVRSHSDSDDSGMEFNQFFPNFLWVVRDFGVRLERNGVRMTARDYLEDALKPEAGVTEATEQKNAVRMLLRNFFPDRDCVTMVRPVTDEKLLNRLATVPLDDLRPEFVGQLHTLKARVTETARPKALFGQALNGHMLGQLALQYVHALNTNQTPTIQSAWDRVAEAQCQAAVDAGLAEYALRMKAFSGGATSSAAGAGAGSGVGGSGSGSGSGGSSNSDGVFEPDDLAGAHRTAATAAMEIFQRDAVTDSDAFPAHREAITTRLAEQYIKFQKRNSRASQALCEDAWDTLYDACVKELETVRPSTPMLRPAGCLLSQPLPMFCLQATKNAPDGGEPASNGTVTPSSANAVARAFRRGAEKLLAEYCNRARGPAKYVLFSERCASQLPKAIAVPLQQVDTTTRTVVNRLQDELSAAKDSVADLENSLRTLKKDREQDRVQFDEQLQTAKADAQASTEELAKVQTTLEAVEKDKSGLQAALATKEALLEKMQRWVRCGGVGVCG